MREIRKCSCGCAYGPTLHTVIGESGRLSDESLYLRCGTCRAKTATYADSEDAHKEWADTNRGNPLVTPQKPLYFRADFGRNFG